MFLTPHKSNFLKSKLFLQSQHIRLRQGWLYIFFFFFGGGRWFIIINNPIVCFLRFHNHFHDYKTGWDFLTLPNWFVSWQACLQMDPENRLSCQELMEMPFFDKHRGIEDRHQEPTVRKHRSKLVRFSFFCVFCNTLLHFLIYFISFHYLIYLYFILLFCFVLFLFYFIYSIFFLLFFFFIYLYIYFFFFILGVMGGAH